MKAYWIELFFSVINLRIDRDMVLSLEDEPALLCSLMCNVHIFDFRSRMVSSVCLI